MLPYFRIGSEIIYTYPLIIGFVWAGSYFIGKEILISKRETIPAYNVYFFGVFVFAWMFSKVLFLITLDNTLVERAIGSSNFWLGGGFVFYGGLIGGALATISFAKFKRVPIKKFSFAIPILALAHSLGRVGCFLAGCCFGSETDFFLNYHSHGADRHIVQVYEAAGLFILGVILIKRFLANKGVMIPYFVSYAILRFLLEFLRGDDIRGVYLLSTSQWISIVIIGLCMIPTIKTQLQSK